MTCWIRGSTETVRAAIADLGEDMRQRGTVIRGHGYEGEMLIEIPGMTVGEIEDRPWFGDITAAYQDGALAEAVWAQWRAAATLPSDDEPEE